MQGAAPDRTGLVDLHWRAAGPGADIGGEEGGDRVTPILTRVAVTAESHPCLQVAAGNRLCRGLDCSLRLLTASAKSEHSVPCHRHRVSDSSVRCQALQGGGESLVCRSPSRAGADQGPSFQGCGPTAGCPWSH